MDGSINNLDLRLDENGTSHHDEGGVAELAAAVATATGDDSSLSGAAAAASAPSIPPGCGGSDLLEKHGRWLMSIPRDDVLALQQTPEYHAFCVVFERLGHAHRRTIVRNRTLNDDGETRRRGYSFLQHLAVDDVVLRVLEFLECRALSRTSLTCHRFWELAHRSAEQRTHDFSDTRVLGSAMKMLRAEEQMEGVEPDTPPFVSIPMLGLSRRIVVTESGDPEYNGVYFCTETNGNGYVFTKPRFPQQQAGVDSTAAAAAASPAVAAAESVSTPTSVATMVSAVAEAWTERIDDTGDGDGSVNAMQVGVDGSTERSNAELERDDGGAAAEAQSEQVLRCVIAKRFSNQTILWYMSKELGHNNPNGEEAEEEFSFWAKLMVIGDATPDICRYPSQTSILSRNGDPAWQSLSSTTELSPPTVELLD